jgi:hypothetical protein
VWVWYAYDMRPEGGTEISLGKDYPTAIAKWRELHEAKPQTVGLVQEAINQYRTEILPTKKSKTLDDYTRYLSRLEPVFGKAAWHEITVPLMRAYLAKRTAKTQGNRELSMLSILWGQARQWGMTELHWPAAGLKKWKNEESAREFEVTDDLFEAVYLEADQVLRDVLDVATSTGLRLTDVLRLTLPTDGRLTFKANKTAKPSYFDVSESEALSAVIARRSPKATSITLIVTERGLPLSMRRLRERYEAARDAAAEKLTKTDKAAAKAIRGMWLKDMRKRAADLADDLAHASKLLQHSSEAVTRKHYRTRGDKLKAVR